ncbi:MAG: hypothetical protein NT007_12275 [Candidatus Kapabacteria bacterium]|nr:hypothetical protein [Candidatus Kapabacteria bacterium]
MMEKEEVKYFNFPIQLLSGFLEDSKTALYNILTYGIYSFAVDYNEAETIEKKIKASTDYHNVKLGNIPNTIKLGKDLYDKFHKGSPMSGIELKVFWTYYDEYKDETLPKKSDFEKVCLLGFLALKSILGEKPYCHVFNDYWLARMDGKVKRIYDVNELSEKIRPYHSERNPRKIKTELAAKWNLKHYSKKGMRGFYVSLEPKMTTKDLIKQVMIRKNKSILEKKMGNNQIKKYEEEILQELNFMPTIKQSSSNKNQSVAPPEINDISFPDWNDPFA